MQQYPNHNFNNYSPKHKVEVPKGCSPKGCKVPNPSPHCGWDFPTRSRFIKYKVTENFIIEDETTSIAIFNGCNYNYPCGPDDQRYLFSGWVCMCNTSHCDQTISVVKTNGGITTEIPELTNIAPGECKKAFVEDFTALSVRSEQRLASGWYWLDLESSK